MRFLIPAWIVSLVLGISIGGAAAFGVYKVAASDRPEWQEWTMPARFEGEGAVTLGCAFWDVPQVSAYGSENPKLGFVGISVSGESGDIQALMAIDGPEGTAFMGGQKCAVSVDWSAFPSRFRAAD
jgi:hypothetical protein